MPFIGLLLPFVGQNPSLVLPFIGRNRPFVPIRRYSGFTLVELIITVVIAGILMSLAAPSFVSFVKNNRISGQANELMADLAFARSEAVKRGANITICRASDPFNACAGGGGLWSTGWIVVDGVGTVLRVHEALSGENTLTGTINLTDNLAYRGSGLIVADLNLNEGFRLCDDRDEPYGRMIQISTTGRAAISKDADGHPTPPANCL